MSTTTINPRRSFLGGGARFLLVTACFVVVVAGLKAGAAILVPFMVGLFIAILTLPLVFGLKRMGLPNWAAVIISIHADIAVLVAASLLVGGSVNQLADSVPEYRARLGQLQQQWLEPAETWLKAKGFLHSEWTAVELIDAEAIVSLVQRSLRGVANVLSKTFLVVLISIFILFEASTFPDKVQAALGRRDAQARFGKMTYEIQRYLAIKTLISGATGTIIGIWASILGIDFAVLWGLTAFLFNFVPNLGSILAALPAVLVALIQLGVGHAILVAIGYLVVNIVIGNFIEPNVMGRRLGLSTLVVFLSLVFWGWVWGPIGMLLSVPLTMIVKIMLENSEDLRPIAVLLGPSPTPKGPHKPRRRRKVRPPLTPSESPVPPAATHPGRG